VALNSTTCLSCDIIEAPIALVPDAFALSFAAPTAKSPHPEQRLLLPSLVAHFRRPPSQAFSSVKSRLHSRQRKGIFPLPCHELSGPMRNMLLQARSNFSRLAGLAVCASGIGVTNQWPGIRRSRAIRMANEQGLV
jgi:hypothetical protein